MGKVVEFYYPQQGVGLGLFYEWVLLVFCHWEDLLVQHLEGLGVVGQEVLGPDQDIIPAIILHHVLGNNRIPAPSRQPRPIANPQLNLPPTQNMLNLLLLQLSLAHDLAQHQGIVEAGDRLGLFCQETDLEKGVAWQR